MHVVLTSYRERRLYLLRHALWQAECLPYGDFFPPELFSERECYVARRYATCKYPGK